ncbi:gamma-type small acid-soluble spore protein [Bacillus subtilis]|nr:gamma-type small acid-soluble spore protein [Bacillus spizizenii]MCY9128774.1 gamma-type small acid-soluble spore protein [Bacillus spizizenii]
MANSNNFSKTNAQQVRKQNQQSAAGQGQFGTEFASETDVQQVRQQNQSAEQNKQQNS